MEVGLILVLYTQMHSHMSSIQTHSEATKCVSSSMQKQEREERWGRGKMEEGKKQQKIKYTNKDNPKSINETLVEEKIASRRC